MELNAKNYYIINSERTALNVYGIKSNKISSILIFKALPPEQPEISPPKIQ